jgi:ATP-dependent Lon protease
VRMPKDVLRILVEAERRAELLNFEEEESEYLRAEVALFTGSDEMQFSDIEQEAMLRNLKELFAVYCEQTQKVSKELAGQILGTEEVGKLVDQICMNLPLDYVNRQKLLEAVELSERYDTLCVMIANEIQIQEIRSEIQGKIKERIDKNQRDYILREQLKVPSGKMHELCRGIHAEQNAVVQAAFHGVSVNGGTLYCTHQPCVVCTKILINAGIKRIVYANPYPDKLAEEILKASKMEITIMDGETEK